MHLVQMPKLMTIHSPEVGQSPEPSCSRVTLQWFIWFRSPLANFSCFPTYLQADQAEQLELDIKWANQSFFCFLSIIRIETDAPSFPLGRTPLWKEKWTRCYRGIIAGAASSPMDSVFHLVVDMWSWRENKQICNRFMVKQSWNLIIKALWGAENSLNKTFQGGQPTPSVPPHYFTYLLAEQAKLPPPRRLLAEAETPSAVHLLFLFVGGVSGRVGWCWPRCGRRGWRETLTLN